MNPPAHLTAVPVEDDIEPGIVGFIDVIEERKISGWAWNPSAPDEHPLIEVFLDGRLIATARAERLRPDLARANVGDGQYGFVALLDEALTFESMGQIVARATGADGEPVLLLNRAQVATTRMISPAEAIVSEVKQLREEAHETQRAFQSTTQSALGEMLRVLERIAREYGTPRKAEAEAKATPEAREGAPDLLEVKQRLTSMEGATLRMDQTLSRMDERLARIEEEASGGIGRGILAAVAFASVLAVVVAALALFR